VGELIENVIEAIADSIEIDALIPENGARITLGQVAFLIRAIR